MQFKTDKYKRARGGHSRLLDISCASCSTHICFYQKDGPGMLKRMYIDRMYGKESESFQGKSVKQLPNLMCTKCRHLLAMPYLYDKEKRPAYRLFVGSVAKKLSSLKELDNQ